MRHPLILLDVGETLLGPRESFGESYARAFAHVGVVVEGERWLSAMRAAWRELTATLPPGVDRYGREPGGDRDFWIRFASGVARRVAGPAHHAELGPAEVAAVVDEIRAHFAEPEAWRVYDEVPEVLDALVEGGARLGVVSNWDSRLPALLERLDLARFFAAIVYSEGEGFEKPDPRLFRAALERLGGEARQALHVGDVPELDLAGARLAGIEVRLIDRHGRLARGYRAESDLRFLLEN